jgi:hypothetical protein
MGAALKLQPGSRYGRLAVIGIKDRSEAGKIRWSCRCDCGNLTVVVGSHLTSGAVISCGCYGRSVAKTHGMSKHPLFRVWTAMIHRCDNPDNKHFKDYGGRGIRVCERWRKFQNFYSDMGERPFVGAEIDRKNNDGDYTPENCRWATRAEQCSNTRANRYIEHNGVRRCVTEWSRLTGISDIMISQRVFKLGWPIHLALSVPPLRKGLTLNRYELQKNATAL